MEHRNVNEETGEISLARREEPTLEFGNFRVSRTGLVISDTPTFEEWQAAGETFKFLETSIQWVLGDWLNYGERAYGEKYAQALDETNYTESTLQTYAYVARQVKSSIRIELLTFKHHQIIAPLEPNEQAYYLALAAPELGEKKPRLTVEALRKQIAKDKRQKLAQEALAAFEQQESEQFTFIEGDILDVLPTLDEHSIDAIITDPPYPAEYLSLYETLAREGKRLLKPGGSLVVMCGQSYLPEIMALMTGHLRYYWTISYQTPGGQAPQIWQRKVITFYKPVLWFVNGDYDGSWIGDVVESDTNDNDKEHHHWGQSESGIGRLVENFTLPGNVVLDPFCGGGTTGVVCARLNRQFIGIDIDGEALEISKARVLGVAHDESQ